MYKKTQKIHKERYVFAKLSSLKHTLNDTVEYLPLLLYSLTNFNPKK